jgi:hypothetical protein
MALQLVEINTVLNYPNGEPAKNVRVNAQLVSPVQNSNGGYVVQNEVKAISDDLGNVSLSLWPNSLGVDDSYYVIEAYDEVLGEILKVISVVPESAIPVNLEDISMSIANLGCSSGSVAGIRRVDTEEGISGGGDLTTNRTHVLDLNTISTEEIAPDVNWIVAVQDPDAVDGVRFSKLGNLPGIGYDSIETILALEGQTEILIEQPFLIDTGSIDLFINGRYQCPPSYSEQEAVGQDPYTRKLVLTEAMEGGEEICVKVKKSASFSSSIDSGQVAYSGGSVEEALDTLFNSTESSPWQITSTNISTTPGQRFFVSTNTGPVSVTLPGFPSLGDTVRVIDITSSSFIGLGNSLLNDITVLRNGEKILELEEDLIIDQARVSLEFIYTGSTVGWVFSE